MAERVSYLFSDAEWVAAAKEATAKAATLDDGMAALFLAEMEPVLKLWYVTGETLGNIQEEKIPENVRDLHDSGAEYWAMLPELLRTTSTEGPFAAFAYIEKIEALTNWNYAAQV